LLFLRQKEALCWKSKFKHLSDSYVDQQIGAARAMINNAFVNDLVGGDTLRTFKKVKKLLKRNSNMWDKALTLNEFNNLMSALCKSLRRAHRDRLEGHITTFESFINRAISWKGKRCRGHEMDR